MIAVSCNSLLQVDLLLSSAKNSVVHPKDVCSLLNIVIQSAENPLEVVIYFLK